MNLVEFESILSLLQGRPDLQNIIREYKHIIVQPECNTSSSEDENDTSTSDDDDRPKPSSSLVEEKLEVIEDENGFFSIL